jgi:hypothetical protein
MNDYAKIEGEEDYVKDLSSGAVLNTNNSSLQNYKKRRAQLLEQNKKVQTLENDVKEIKKMLQQLLERG